MSLVRVFQRLFHGFLFRFQHFVLEAFIAEKIAPWIVHKLYPKRQVETPQLSEIKSILIWNIDSLGDSLWITPTIKSLRMNLPGAKITLICNQAVQDLFLTNPFLDEVIPVEAEIYYRASGYFKKFYSLMGRQFDLMMVLEMGSRPADRGRLLGRELGVKYLISSELGLFKNLADYTLPKNLNQYWPQYFQKALVHLGMSANSPQLEIKLTDADSKKAQAVFESLQARQHPQELVIGLHPCVAPYANLTKKWPASHFAELAMKLSETQDRPLHFVLTGSAAEKAECEAVAKTIQQLAPASRVSVVAGELKVREFSAFCKNLDLFVVGDTGALHLAASVQTPTIALFGATDPQTIAPPACTSLSAGKACSPCHKSQDHMPFWPKCIYEKPLCLEELDPTLVAQKAHEVLFKKKARHA